MVYRPASTGTKSGFISLRRKLLFSFGALFAVSLVMIELLVIYGIPFTGYQGRYSVQKAEVYKDLERAADAKKDTLQFWLKERRNDVQLFAQDESFRQALERINLKLSRNGGDAISQDAFRNRLSTSGDWRWLNRRLREIMEANPENAIDIISAKNGIVVGCSRDLHVGESRLDDHGYRDAVDPLYDEVIRTAIDKDGSYRLYISRSIYGTGSRTDEVIAVITINTDLDSILRPMVNSGLDYGRTGEVLLVNSEGRSLTSLRHPGSAGAPVRPLLDRVQMHPVDLAIAGGEGITAAKDYRGTQVLAAYRHLRISSDVVWGMVVKIDQEEAFAQLRQSNYFILLLGISGCMLVMLLTGVLSGRLARPLDLLHQAAKRVEAGDLTVRTEIRTNDEVGALAASFNGMVAQIQGWHEELEAKVSSRTEQLAASNRLLIEEMEERKRAVGALLQSETQFRELLENIQLVALTLDKCGNIIFCNDYLLNLTGWRREEVFGFNWFERFIPKELSPVIKDVFIRGIENGDIQGHFENAILTRDGKSRHIVWDNTILHNPDRSVTGVASIGVDVTDHRAVEEQLRQSQKMEAIGRLAGGVAHDFNNMLGVIIGYAELSMRNLSRDDKLWHRLNEIAKAAHRSSDITRQLLAFSRKEVIAPRTVNLNSLILETEKTLGRLIGEDINLCFRPASDLWSVKVDPSQIDQILINLAVNARDAMPDGGTLTIETGNSRLDEAYCHYNINARPGDFVRISVSDTGVGMDSETRNHIFEPFFTTKEVGKGTGLGLATIFGIVTQNNGFINVYSEPGLGSTFTVYLPCSMDADHEAVPRKSTPLTGSGTVMVVEDELSLLEMTTDMLEQIGYTVISFSDPDSALRQCHDMTTKIDLIITDVIMPTMNGKELVEQVSCLRPGIRVLYVSGYTSDIIAQKGVLEEGTNFLMKPFDMNTLNEKLREIMNDTDPQAGEVVMAQRIG